MIHFLLDTRKIDLDDSILVVGGGTNDRNALFALKFKNVIISNVSHHAGVKEYHPYEWIKADINNLHFNNNQFDWVFVSAALHHLYSPHRGLCEMLRVAKNGVFVIESRDNLLSRIGRKLNLIPEYEIDAILRDGKGGVEDSHIPNFIYRWTRAEIIKTTNSFLPHTKNKFFFFNNYQIPLERLKRSKKTLIKLLFPFIKVSVTLIRLFFPKQANEFGFIIVKGKKLHPWLKGKLDSPDLNLNYIRERFKTSL